MKKTVKKGKKGKIRWTKSVKNLIVKKESDGKRMMDMIDLHGDISIPFLKKSRFTGSYLGMRYQLMKAERPKNQTPSENGEGSGEEAGREETEMETVLRAVIWPEPFNFEVTPEEKKHSMDFPFDADGLWAAVDWLNEEHEAGHF